MVVKPSLYVFLSVKWKVYIVVVSYRKIPNRQECFISKYSEHGPHSHAQSVELSTVVVFVRAPMRSVVSPSHLSRFQLRVGGFVSRGANVKHVGIHVLNNFQSAQRSHMRYN